MGEFKEFLRKISIFYFQIQNLVLSEGLSEGKNYFNIPIQIALAQESIRDHSRNLVRFKSICGMNYQKGGRKI